MAGDWIKVEKSTAGKPEVLRIADLLSVHPTYAFGLCVKFWFWCDDQMANGNAESVTNVTLDSHIGHAGFVDALLSVGWLRVRHGSLEVPNFDRHLSQSAKNRALCGNRQQKLRVSRKDEKCNANPVTREEKREELNPSSPRSPPSGYGPKSQALAQQFVFHWTMRKGTGKTPISAVDLDSQFTEHLRVWPDDFEWLKEEIERPDRDKNEWPGTLFARAKKRHEVQHGSRARHSSAGGSAGKKSARPPGGGEWETFDIPRFRGSELGKEDGKGDTAA